MKVSRAVMPLGEPEQKADHEHGYEDDDEVFRDRPIEKIPENALPCGFPADFIKTYAEA
jgi:hypothetical protein